MAMAPIDPLVWEPPCATRAAQEMAKRKKKKKKKTSKTNLWLPKWRRAGGINLEV